jgi:hypothetical protein
LYSVTLLQLLAHVVPPKSTLTWRAASKLRPIPSRTGGAFAVATRVQLLPSYSQVSFWFEIEAHELDPHFSPPKSTTTWRTLS